MKAKCCGGVIESGGQILMVLQDNGVCAFPKGHVEEGETEIETAEREILEETGIEAELDAERRFEFGYHIKDQDIDKTVVLFIGRPKNLETKAQEGEISSVEWVAINEVEDKLQFPEWKEVWHKIKEEL
ncbi:NUDIX domain-containing protein [Candidatus Saccharibacteria bacterium]|nr:NUDIX domain-containing protein [Candidatus Saccharibacteria bacterium]